MTIRTPRTRRIHGVLSCCAAVASLLHIGPTANAGGPRWIDVNNSEEPGRYITGMLEWDPDGPAPDSEGTVLVVGTDQATTAGGFQAPADKAWAFRFNGVDWAPLGRDSTFTFPAPARDFAEYAGQLYAAAGSVLRYDGTTWQIIGTPNAGGTVTEIISWNGGLYAAGTFAEIDGVAVSNIATWDGSAWTPLGTGLTGTTGGTGGIVQDLELFQNQLVAAGTFTSAGGTAVTALATWDGNAWLAYAGAITGATPLVVNTLSAAPGADTLYIGGNFNTVDGVEAGFCVARNAAGWVTLPALRSTPDMIRALMSGVYAVGNFGDGLPGLRTVRRLEQPAWKSVIESASGPLSNGAAAIIDYRTVPVATRRFSPITPGSGVLRCIDGVSMFKLGVNSTGLNTSFLSGPDGFVFCEPMAPNWTRNGLARGMLRWDGQEFHSYLPELKARSVTSSFQLGDDLVVAGDFAPGNAAGARRIAIRRNGVWSPFEAGIPYVPAIDFDFVVTSIAFYKNEYYVGIVDFSTAQSPVNFYFFNHSIWKWNGKSWTRASGPINTNPLSYTGLTSPLTHQFMATVPTGYRKMLATDDGLVVAGSYLVFAINGVQPVPIDPALGDPLRLNDFGWGRMPPAAGALQLGSINNINAGGLWDVKRLNGDLYTVGTISNNAGGPAYSGLMKWTLAGWTAPDTRVGARSVQGLLGSSNGSAPLTVPRGLLERNGVIFTAGAFAGSFDQLPASPALAPGMSSIAAYNGEGWVNLSWRNPETGQLGQGLTASNGTTVNDAYALATIDNKLLILGTFAKAGGLSSPNIAVFDPGDAPVFTSNSPITIPACPSPALSIPAPEVTFAEADQWRHYQWFKNGLPMVEGAATTSGFGIYTGTQTATLVISNPQPSDSNAVVCKVTTIGGVVYSPTITPRILPDVSATPNGVVDTADLVFFLGRFGEAAPAGSPAARVDFNNDGTVNTPDLTTFLGRFGSVCPR